MTTIIVTALLTALFLAIIFLLWFRKMQAGFLTFEKEDGVPYKWTLDIDPKIGILTDLPNKKYIIIRVREKYSSSNEEDIYRKEN